MVVAKSKNIKCTRDPRRSLIAACIGLVVCCTFMNLGNYGTGNSILPELLEFEYSIANGRQNTMSSSQKKRFGREKAAALDYVKRFRGSSFDRPLSFFHIPKTAGTAIEHVAGSSTTKIGWGSCMFNHGKRKRTDCEYPSGGKWPDFIAWWHIPSHFFPLGRINPYDGTELFGVTRHPYDRMVSEFYYICTLKVFEWRPDQCDRTRLFDEVYMNEWLDQKIRQQNRRSGAAYLMDNGHFTPQYDFIFAPNDVRMIDYVLTMDSSQTPLSDQFNLLMNSFSRPEIQLVKFNAFGAENRTADTHLTVTHLNLSLICLIHNLHGSDFRLGYIGERSKLKAC